MSSRKNEKPVPVASLFTGLLPAGFAQKRAQIQQFQQFFEMQESDAVFQMVRVTNVTDSYLNIALPNAALSSYLRLHSEQILQLIGENFGLVLTLKISTRPELFNPQEQKGKKEHFADISPSSCEQMQSTADYVQDDDLKKALKSLSRTLSRDNNSSR